MWWVQVPQTWDETYLWSPVSILVWSLEIWWSPCRNLSLCWTQLAAHSTTLPGCTDTRHGLLPRKHIPDCSPSMEGASAWLDWCKVQHHRMVHEGLSPKQKGVSGLQSIRVPTDKNPTLCWFTGVNMLLIPHFWMGTTHPMYCMKRNHPKQWLKHFFYRHEITWPSQAHQKSMRKRKPTSRLWNSEIHY